MATDLIEWWANLSDFLFHQFYLSFLLKIVFFPWIAFLIIFFWFFKRLFSEVGVGGEHPNIDLAFIRFLRDKINLVCLFFGNFSLDKCCVFSGVNLTNFAKLFENSPKKYNIKQLGKKNIKKKNLIEWWFFGDQI